ncbi:MAG: DUF4249 family protein [Nanoarchaeota archaeon]
MKKYFIFLLFLNSCKNGVGIDLPPFKEKLVVESYIVQGDSAFIVHIDKTVDPIYRGTTFLYDTNFAGTEVVLSYNNNSYTLRPLMDYLESTNHGRSFVLDKKVENVNTLQLVATYRNLQVKSMCSLLPAVHIKTATLIGTSSYSESESRNLYTKFTAKVEADFPSGSSYYIMRIMRPSLDILRDHLLLREVAKGYFIVNNSVQQKEFIFNHLPFEQVGWFNNYTIILTRIEKLHYDFIISTIAQFGELGNIIPSETTEIPTNIIGGYGIFTMMSNDTIRVPIQ